jgi:hypothetical protein
MISSYTHYTIDGVEYEVHFTLDCGEIVDYSLYPDPSFDLTRTQEREIFELIYDAGEEE